MTVPIEVTKSDISSFEIVSQKKKQKMLDVDQSEIVHILPRQLMYGTGVKQFTITGHTIL